PGPSPGTASCRSGSRTSPLPFGSSSWQWSWGRRSGAIGWRNRLRREAAPSARRSEAGTVAGLVRDHWLLHPLHGRLLRHHAHPAAREALVHTRSGGWVVL